jgi:hypothetical protein
MKLCNKNNNFRPRPATRPPTTTTTTPEPTVRSSYSSYSFKRPEETSYDSNNPCKLEEMCDVTEKNYPL